MRIAFILIICFCSFNLAKAETILANYYNVVSDVFDAGIPPGNCLVTGTASDVNVGVIQGATVANLDRSFSATTDNMGNYTLLLSSKDTAVFFYHPSYGEVVLWNYPFKSQHHVIIDFYSMKESDYPVVAEKPVIYFYSEAEMDVHVDLSCKADLLFTYPEYQHGWNFSLNQNKLTDVSSGRTYPYLFWEGKTDGLDFNFSGGKIDGFVIKTDTVISFLETSLTNMGLNSTEQADFITYWGPRMVNHQYVLIQFLNTEQYGKEIASLSISPSPDHLLRTFMLFCPLETDQLSLQVVPQKFEPFNRSGFTVVEWGGAELRTIQLTP